MRILLVEEEHEIARAIEHALEQEGCVIDVAYDGDTGYVMATTKAYDLVIIDHMIPGEYDGADVIRAMREKKIHTPALILLTLSTSTRKTKNLSSGADDYLVKPFSLAELLAHTRALLHQPPEKTNAILAVGDLELDTTTLTVKRNGQTIHLTSKEYALLEYLLRNQNRPSSKEMIVAHVWNYDANVLLNTVEVYIKYLRAKVDDPFSTKMIKTVRGFGYKIEG